MNVFSIESEVYLRSNPIIANALINNDVSQSKVHIAKADGKNVIRMSNHNYPKPKLLNEIYKKLPDDKSVPVVLETRKQYLQEYIKNQEKKRKIDFSPEEEKEYIEEEHEKLKDVDARFTTYHNKYMEPRVVIFPQKGKLNKIYLYDSG